GVKIYASCKKTFVHKVEKQLRYIKNFSLITATVLYRPINHLYKMIFTSFISVTRSEKTSDDLFITLTSFEQILHPALNRHFLIDVFGQIMDMGEIKTVLTRRKFNFIFVMRNLFKLFMWIIVTNDWPVVCGEDLLNRFVLLAMKVIQFLFAKINIYKGELQVTISFESSKILINAPLPEVTAFKN
ncbi:unnamed protein product, partial [Thlaspi arvense]